jgi:class 3 adenylate cyclase
LDPAGQILDVSVEIRPHAKHTGDGIFALFDGPTKAARCALDLVPALGTRGIRIRAGVHIGECEQRGDEWSGVASDLVGDRVGADAGDVGM